MKTFFTIPVLCAGLSLAAVPLTVVKKETNLPIAPNKFIVELESTDSLNGKRSVSPHARLYESLHERDVGFKIDREFNAADIFVGAALTLDDVTDLINNLAGVKAIRPVRSFRRPEPVSTHVVTDVNDPAIPPDSESTHILTGVDKLHAQGIAGSGITVGMYPTIGIDYTHPLLGGGFGPGHKVVGGFDLVGDAYDGTNEPVPDPDPLDQCAGHGTHVAGIVGANPGNEFNISGVAYEANLAAYRVFGCEGFVTDDVLVDALIRGFQDDVDILTLSLGGADGWTESSSSVVASAIARTGKIVTIAAGNDGASGSWYTSSPGNGIDVISVASLDNTVIPLQNATVGGVTHDPITYFETFPFPINGTLPIFATSNDTTVADDACAPLDDSVPDLSGFVVIVRRGTCTFVQKISNIAAKGAQVALIYDNGNGFNAISVGDFNAALIQAADGEFLVQQFAAGAPVTITFPQTGGLFNFPDAAGGLISSFTSYGPSNDFFFKPAIAAPGGNILSTLPVPLGSFGVESGTSMATPFLAGSAALLFSVKGTDPSVGRNARTLFETTSTLVPSSHTDGDPLQTVTQQGSGLINVFNAIHATTIVSPGELILNDTAHFQQTQRFTVRNTGESSKEYSLTHVSAGTAITVTPDTIFPATGPVPLTADAASVTLSAPQFTLGAGQSKTIVATFSPPEGVDAATFPVFSGFIQISSGPDDVTHVTYLGLAASLIDKQVVDNTDFFFGVTLPVVLDAAGDVQDGATNYTFEGGDFPTLLFRLVFGTPFLRVDLVDASLDFAPTLNQRALNIADGQVFPLGQLDFLTRNNEDPNDNGFFTLGFTEPVFANGTAIPDGLYKILFRALKVTGNAHSESDFESFLSPIVGVFA
ncbi:subtilisin-like protease [Hymenopellis radicata]|nr:subtilisin-like protease [Hymenopellis radicata]